MPSRALVGSATPPRSEKARRDSAGLADALRCAGRSRASFSPERQSAGHGRRAALVPSPRRATWIFCGDGLGCGTGQRWSRAGQNSGMERSVGRMPLRRKLRCGRLPRAQMMHRLFDAQALRRGMLRVSGVRRAETRLTGIALSFEGSGVCVLTGENAVRR